MASFVGCSARPRPKQCMSYTSSSLGSLVCYSGAWYEKCPTDKSTQYEHWIALLHLHLLYTRSGSAGVGCGYMHYSCSITVLKGEDGSRAFLRSVLAILATGHSHVFPSNE